MVIPRFVHRVYAWAAGYFWAECPLCGRMFGGHERHGEPLRYGKDIGRSTCDDLACTKVAILLNAERGWDGLVSEERAERGRLERLRLYWKEEE